MARYIELEKAIKVFEIADADVCANYGADYGCEFGFSRDAIRRELEQLPAADVVVVVHCKDCRYRGIIYCPAVHETMGNGLVDYTSDETYCWRGRPKEDADAT